MCQIMCQMLSDGRDDTRRASGWEASIMMTAYRQLDWPNLAIVE